MHFIGHILRLTSVEKYIDLISLRRKKMEQYKWEEIGKQLSTNVSGLS